MDIAARILAGLLLVGAALHAWGSFMAFRRGSAELVWSLGSACFAALLAALGWLAAGRTDPALAALICAGCLAWVVIVWFFGRAIGRPSDPRVLYHLIVGLGLALVMRLGMAGS